MITIAPIPLVENALPAGKLDHVRTHIDAKRTLCGSVTSPTTFAYTLLGVIREAHFGWALNLPQDRICAACRSRIPRRGPAPIVNGPTHVYIARESNGYAVYVNGRLTLLVGDNLWGVPFPILTLKVRLAKEHNVPVQLVRTGGRWPRPIVLRTQA